MSNFESSRRDLAKFAVGAAALTAAPANAMTGTTLWSSLAAVAAGNAPMPLTADPYYKDLAEHGKVPTSVVALPMLKFICLIPKPPALSNERFHSYWLETHSQNVTKVAKTLAMKRYVQSHLVASPTIDSFGSGRNWTPNPYSGVTEIWWESEVAMAAAFASEAGKAASAFLAADERHFSDDSVVVWAAREYVIFDYKN